MDFSLQHPRNALFTLNALKSGSNVEAQACAWTSPFASVLALRITAQLCELLPLRDIMKMAASFTAKEAIMQGKGMSGNVV